MNKTLLALTFAATLATAAGSATAGTSVGVSIGINQPGVYGRINIGDVPQPALVYPQPVLIAPPPVAVRRQPIYLYVPPAHQRDWRRYCGRYAACGQPVYFVQEQWVRDRYQREHPGWRDHRDDRRDDRRFHGRGPDWDRDHGRDHGRDHDRGRHDGPGRN